ncbi:hypothetical protein NQK81_01800 [Amycolatopsis roodepoortensis]|uniref:hypothetical protein n=1 Tax=Amycolatopsis roodepoortensis TaxID=700274 RepID=UPI00214CF6CC|nr:hypothetical protein [Amycolatopsis roodepoortensis]UUV32208.1 hypothetical protein NQK81_01800 [Amycolatopsis roodepoortensis]
METVLAGDDMSEKSGGGDPPVVALAAPAGLRAKFTSHADIGPRGDAVPVAAFSAAGEALVLDVQDGRLHPVSTRGWYSSTCSPITRSRRPWLRRPPGPA